VNDKHFGSSRQHGAGLTSPPPSLSDRSPHTRTNNPSSSAVVCLSLMRARIPFLARSLSLSLSLSPPLARSRRSLTSIIPAADFPRERIIKGRSHFIAVPRESRRFGGYSLQARSNLIKFVPRSDGEGGESREEKRKDTVHATVNIFQAQCGYCFFFLLSFSLSLSLSLFFFK
jgi:hypothetical protein